MKKLILSLIVCCMSSFLYAQLYKIPSGKMASLFAEMYTTTDKKQNFFTRIAETAGFFFSSENEAVQKTIKDLSLKYKISVDSSVNILFDTVMLAFAQQHIWDEYADQKEKYSPFYELYNQKICLCITDKINQSRLKRMEEKDMANCIGRLASDTAYINGARKTIGAFTMNEIYAASQMAGLYMYQRCEPLYDYFAEVIRHESISVYLIDFRHSFFDLDTMAINLYSTRSPKLPVFFPSYKKYEADLKSAGLMINNKNVDALSTRDKDASGKLIITKTYYSYENANPFIHGQLVYIIKEEIPDAPVLSFRFTPGSKMKDRDKYMVQLEDQEIMEPPPMEELMEIRIDTTRRKN